MKIIKKYQLGGKPSADSTAIFDRRRQLAINKMYDDSLSPQDKKVYQELGEKSYKDKQKYLAKKTELPKKKIGGLVKPCSNCSKSNKKK